MAEVKLEMGLKDLNVVLVAPDGSWRQVVVGKQWAFSDIAADVAIAEGCRVIQLKEKAAKK